jgi:hypothetical protein
MTDVENFREAAVSFAAALGPNSANDPLVASAASKVSEVYTTYLQPRAQRAPAGVASDGPRGE